MIESNSVSRKVFMTFDYVFMILLACTCVLPFLHVLAVSLSSSGPVSAGTVKLWPVGFTLDSYKYILEDQDFFRALWTSVKRVLLGTGLGIFLTVLTAYPLSKEPGKFRTRNIYTWYFVITMLIGGGLIPLFMTVKSYGLYDSIWALVLPSAVPVFNVVLLLNYFRGVPKELEESAFIDGAGHWNILFKIYLPISVPSLATITLFTIVAHWNAWFDGLIFMNRPEKYPLQTYLQMIVVQPNLTQIADLGRISNITDRTVKTTQILLGMLPILCVYPLLQRYFISGIVLGSVKG